MRDNIIVELNNIVSNREWFDFSILKYSSAGLEIVGSIDLTYFYELRVIFSDVFFMSILNQWKANMNKPFIEIVDGDDMVQLNIKYRVDVGYKIFRIWGEDDMCFYIMSRDIEFAYERRYWKD